MSNRSAWLVPVGLAVAIALYNLVLNPAHGRGSATDVLTVLGMGVIFVQPALLAAWVALGPGSLVYRLPLCAATLVAWIFAFSIPVWNVVAVDGSTTDLNLEMAVAFLAAFAVGSIVFGLVRRPSGLRIARRERAKVPLEVRHQFGIKYLLGLMTVCALLIVVGRSLDSGWLELNRPWLDFLFEAATGVLFVSLLMIPPVVLPLLAMTRPTPWRWLLLVVAAWPVLFWLAILVLKLNSNPGPPQNVYTIFAGVQLGATATALACATVLRVGGFQVTNSIDDSRHDGAAQPA